MGQLSKAACAALSLLVIILCGGSSHAQIPDEYTNLKILDEKIQKPQLVGTMRDISQALGVRCVYCHVGGDTPGLSGVDFASDEKPTKQAAREMMRMTKDINENRVADLPTDHTSRVEVRCVTCHRGQARPFLIQERLDQAFAAGGLDSAKALYLDLRDKYYGSHTYDLSEGELLNYAMDLFQRGETEAAQSFMHLATELYPDSPAGWVQIGFVAFRQGNAEEARTNLQRALELDPDNRQAKRLIQQLDDNGEN